MSESIRFAGVHSGIDFDVIIDSEMQAKRVPLDRLESRRALWQAKLNAVDDMKSRMSALKSAADVLNDAEKLRAVSAKSSDTSVLGASATSGATQGTYQIEVNALAKAEKEVHSGVAGLDSLVGEGQFVYTYGGTTRTIYTSATTTLEDLVDLINKDANNPGVSASVLEYNAGAGQEFHLVLTGQDTGSSNSITIEAGTDLADFQPASFTETQAASNAQVRVDGYPAGSWIERESNSINDIIPEVTLTLSTTGSSTVTVNKDNGDVVEVVQSLVDAYNEVIAGYDGYTDYSKDTGKAGILQGDSTINGLLNLIRSPLVERVPGFDANYSTHTMAAEIGLELDRDGKLSLDTTALTDALDEDYEGTLALIGADYTGLTTDSYFQYNSSMSKTQAGEYDVKVEFDGETITGAWIKLKTESVSAYRAATVDGNTITGSLDGAEAGLGITVMSDGTAGVHTQQAEVHVRQGFAGGMYDELDDMLHVLDGVFTTHSKQMQSAIDQVDKQIDAQESRLEIAHERLVQKYARLEALLAQIEASSSAYEALFASLDSSKEDK